MSLTKTLFVQLRVDLQSHKVSAQGIAAEAEKSATIAELPYQTVEKGIHAVLVALNYKS